MTPPALAWIRKQPAGKTGWQHAAGQVLAGVVTILSATLSPVDPAWADATAGRTPSVGSSSDARGAAAAARVMAWRAHGICPMASDRRGVQTISSLADWQRHITQAEPGALGRRVRWGQERVVVFSLGQQPQMGTQLASPSSLPIREGVLWWPVTVRRPDPAQLGVTAVGRPCVIAAVSRTGWKRVRVIERDGGR